MGGRGPGEGVRQPRPPRNRDVWGRLRAREATDAGEDAGCNYGCCARGVAADPGSLGAIKIWLLVYLVVTMAGALFCGDRWCARADPFEVYSVVASRLSVLRRNRDGRIGPREREYAVAFLKNPAR